VIGFAALAFVIGIFIALAMAYVFPNTSIWVLVIVGTIIAAGGMWYFGDKDLKKKKRDYEDYQKDKRIEDLERRVKNMEQDD